MSGGDPVAADRPNIDAIRADLDEMESWLNDHDDGSSALASLLILDASENTASLLAYIAALEADKAQWEAQRAAVLALLPPREESGSPVWDDELRRALGVTGEDTDFVHGHRQDETCTRCLS